MLQRRRGWDGIGLEELEGLSVEAYNSLHRLVEATGRTPDSVLVTALLVYEALATYEGLQR